HHRLFEIRETWWMWCLLFVGVDFFYYWFHRLSHEVNVLWGAHIVHHQSEEYNLSVALRQSSFQGFFSMIFYLPLALIGFNPLAFVTINAFQTLYQFWIHTKTIHKLPGPVEFIFNTPSHHRVHHGRNPRYIDKNHGGTLIVFDRIFGTFQKEDEEVVYGVTRPLQSWNPVWANVDYYVDLWRELKRPMRIADRLRLLFAYPGWMPEHLGGYRPPPEVTAETAEVFDTAIPRRHNAYILVHYLVILLATTLFLFEAEGLTRIMQWVVSAWIILSIASIGLLSEGKRWTWYLEAIRLLLSIPLMAVLGASLPVIAGGAAFAIVLLFLVARIS
ncbi:MAG: sterol desaturase family protein, partial [Saprospiraceae bacterium]|nr:sterol desaturase family protein [Saprospiraceae bacterium]